MKNLITFLFLVIFLSYNYLENGRVSSKLFLSDEINSKLEEKSKKILVDGIYFLYRKCNLNNKKCHQLYPIKKNGFYILDGNQEPYEERMYLYIKGDTKAVYSLIYYDEEMIPTITWSKLFNDKTDSLTYLTNETIVVSGIDDNISINNFDFSGNTNSDIKIGTFPKGSRYYLKQKILFNFEENGDLSINCKEYLNNLKQLNNDKSSHFGGIFEIGCDKNSFFRNTAKYGENRAIYFKKIK